MQPREKKIYIQDILARGQDGEYVEDTENKNKHPRSDPSTLPRLIKHIKKTINYADNEHAKLPIEEKANTITRVIFNEYSLYPKHTPLMLSEYNALANKIAKSTKKLPPNIHFVIGSLPVLWPDNLLHNVCLYVESPIKLNGSVRIYHIDKQNPSSVDFKYTDPYGKPYLCYGANEKNKIASDKKFPPNAIFCHSITTNHTNQYQSAIKIKTASGNSALVAIDICFDHEAKEGIKNTYGLMKKLAQHHKKIPEAASHVVVSNSIIANKYHRIASLTQADGSEMLSSLDQLQKTVELAPETLDFGKALSLHHLKRRKLKPLKTNNFKRSGLFPLPKNDAEIKNPTTSKPT